jgi:hypothetical protein
MVNTFRRRNRLIKSKFYDDLLSTGKNNFAEVRHELNLLFRPLEICDYY